MAITNTQRANWAQVEAIARKNAAAQARSEILTGAGAAEVVNEALSETCDAELSIFGILTHTANLKGDADEKALIALGRRVAQRIEAYAAEAIAEREKELIDNAGLGDDESVADINARHRREFDAAEARAA